MVRLDRCECPEKDGWAARVKAAFPARCAFWKKARAFEALALNDPKRRDGFGVFAGRALPRKASTQKKREFPSLWRDHKQIVEQLATMSKGHCAYCQKYIRDEQFVVVEHYQPKSLFPLRAYEWENYLPSCAKCNVKKGDRWPSAGAYVRPDDGGDPASRFVFDEKGTIRAAKPDDEDAKATIRDLGLNRKALRRMRRTEIEVTMKALRGAVKLAPGNEAALRTFFGTQLRGRLSKFSEAVNQNARREWVSCSGLHGPL